MGNRRKRRIEIRRKRRRKRRKKECVIKKGRDKKSIFRLLLSRERESFGNELSHNNILCI
jgi:hypothetical protein